MGPVPQLAAVTSHKVGKEAGIHNGGREPVSGRAGVFKSSGEGQEFSSTKKQHWDLNLQPEHARVREQFEAEIPSSLE